MITLNANEEKVKKTIFANQKLEVQSNLAFLNAHNGLRKGKIHTFMAGAGVGKSTLVRTILSDILDANMEQCPKIGLWLSEETTVDLQSQFFKGKDFDDKYAMVDIDSEMDNFDLKASKFRFMEMLNSCDVFIYDNLTTSRFYNDKKPAEQAEMLYFIKSEVMKRNIVCILVVHADGNFNEYSASLLSINDVRGSKTIGNISEFFYTIQSLYISNKKNNFLCIKKHRGQDCDGIFYMLPYDHKTATYKRDVNVTFEEINKLFKLANKVKL